MTIQFSSTAVLQARSLVDTQPDLLLLLYSLISQISQRFQQRQPSCLDLILLHQRVGVGDLWLTPLSAQPIDKPHLLLTRAATSVRTAALCQPDKIMY